jgi:four helix bundle protein
MNSTAEALQKKSFDFSVRMIKLARFLSKRRPDWILAKQILRSGTSIGANIRESQFAQSKADFVSKLSIALKEASETQYWLELMSATDLLTDEQFSSLKTDLDSLVGTLVNIIKASKRNLKPRSGDLTI